jgi:hypothetical protein
MDLQRAPVGTFREHRQVAMTMIRPPRWRTARNLQRIPGAVKRLPFDTKGLAPMITT